MAAIATKPNLSVPTLPANPLAGTPDCDRVNIVLDQLLEGRSLAEADEEFLVHHAEDCSPCFDDLRKQQFFIGFLSDKVARRSAPGHLHGTILARVQSDIA